MPITVPVYVDSHSSGNIPYPSSRSLRPWMIPFHTPENEEDDDEYQEMLKTERENSLDKVTFRKGHISYQM